MADVLRLIAVLLLAVLGSVAEAESSQTCDASETKRFRSYPGSDSICRSGCWFDLESVWEGHYHYTPTGEKCAANEQNACSAIENKHTDYFRGYDFCSSEDNCVYTYSAFISTPTEEYYGYVRTGDTCSGSGDEDIDSDDETTDIPPCTSVSENKHHCIDKDGRYLNNGPDAPLCDKNAEYLHDCYGRNGKYWDMQVEYDICDPDEYPDDRHNCFFGEHFYRIAHWGGDNVNKWRSWYEYKREECLSHYELRNDKNFLDYCTQRYGDSVEADLYDHAMFGALNDKNVTQGLPGNTTVNIREKLGITDSGNGSLSSTIPDILENKKPQGATCLEDVTIEVFEHEIIIPVSLVCPWLGYLGTVLVILSLISAINIIYRGGNEKT